MYFGEIERSLCNALKLQAGTKPKTITNEVMASTILKALETNEDFQKAKAILDYANVDMWHTQIITADIAWDSYVMAVVNTGGSEGIYIDWYLKYHGENVHLGTLKTLWGDFAGYRIMGEIAGMLTVATELFVCDNLDLFLKEENWTC